MLNVLTQFDRSEQVRKQIIDQMNGTTYMMVKYHMDDGVRMSYFVAMRLRTSNGVFFCNLHSTETRVPIKASILLDGDTAFAVHISRHIPRTVWFESCTDSV